MLKFVPLTITPRRKNLSLQLLLAFFVILSNFQTKAQKTNVEQVDFVFIETLSNFNT